MGALTNNCRMALTIIKQMNQNIDTKSEVPGLARSVSLR